MFLVERTDFFHARLRVLHQAPERCFVAPFRQLHGRRYVTIDKYSDRADHQADVTALLFADASFDTALSCHVLEHVEDDQSAIAKLARVLPPGGYHITGITGSRNGVAITRLEPAGEAIPGNPGFPVDNLVTAGGLL